MSLTKISDYQQLLEIAAKFADGNLDRVLIRGNPGVFKTETIKKTMGSMGSEYLYFRGKYTGITLYEELYWGRGLPVVMDDTSEMLKDPAVQELLRDLLETTRVKTLSWRTQNQKLAQQGIPGSFQTRSRCLIITNKIGTGGVWDAILSRVLAFTFEPTWHQVLDHMESWFADDEILNAARTSQKLLRATPDGRRLVNALNVKKVGLETVDWQSVLLSGLPQTSGESNQASEILKTLLNDGSLTQNERVGLFQEKTGLKRSTFYSYQKELIEEGFLPTPAKRSAMPVVSDSRDLNGDIDPVVSIPMNVVGL
jgi:hypothetical protein